MLFRSQEMRKLFGGRSIVVEDMVVPSSEETILGTNRTQLMYIVRSFFLLLGMEALFRLLTGSTSGDIDRYYPLLAYIGLIGSVILLDYKATISNKRLYIKKGVVEIVGMTLILMLTYWLSLAIRPVIALPQIFFAVLVSGCYFLYQSFYRLRYGILRISRPLYKPFE